MLAGFIVVLILPEYIAGYRLTADEIAFFIWMIGEEGLTFSTIWNTAMEQGRVGFIVILPINAVTALLADQIWFRVLYTLAYFGFLLLAATHAARLLRLTGPLPLFLVMVLFHPLGWEHMPPTAFPLQNTIPFICVLVARLQVMGADDPRGRLTRRHFGAGALLLFGCLATEYAFLLAVALMLVERTARFAALRGVSLRRRLGHLARAPVDRVDIAVIILFAVIYVGFRVLHPSSYDGNHATGLFDPWSVLVTATLRIASGVFFNHLGELTPRDVTVSQYTAIVVLVVLASVVFRLSIRQAFGQTYPLWVPVAWLAAAYITVSATSVVAKYQGWCTIDSCGFLDSRTAYPFISVVLVALTAAILRALRIQADGRLFATLFAMGVFLSAIHNAELGGEFARSGAVWDRAEAQLCTETGSVDGAMLARLDADAQIHMHPQLSEEMFWTAVHDWLRSSGRCPA